MPKRPAYTIILLTLAVLCWLRVAALLTGEGTLPLAPAEILLCALLFGVVLFLQNPGAAGRVARGLGADQNGAEGPSERPLQASLSPQAWLLIGGGVLIIAVIALEMIQHCYFTQDDAFVTELPGLLWGCRSIWHGVFPNWNPYQYMGEPFACVGLSAMTYPPTLLAYAIARHCLHNEYLSIEVFSIGHLLVGYLVTWWLARLLGLRPALGTTLSLSFVLSGFSLIAGRSWHNFMPLLVWLPVFLGSLVLLERGPVSWKWVLGTALAIGLFFHNGFTQVWVYALGFCALRIVLVVLAGKMPLRRALWALPALGLGVALSAPVMLVQLNLIRDVVRPGGGGIGIGSGVVRALLTYPFAGASHRELWGTTDMGQLCYSGTLLLLTTFVAWLSIVAYRVPRRVLKANLWLLLAGVAFLLALGPQGILWNVMRSAPLLGKFNHPFRFLPFFTLFASCGACVCLERLLRGAARPRRWEMAIGFTVIALLLLHVGQARDAFYTYGNLPYPPLPPAMAALLGPGPGQQRMLSVSPTRSGRPGYVLALKHGLPSVYNVMSFDGYNPAVECLPETTRAVKRLRLAPLAAARAYGIRWVVVYRDALKGIPSPAPETVSQAFEQQVDYVDILPVLQANARRVVALPEVSVWELPDPAPLAFLAANPPTPLSVRQSGAGVDVALPANSGGGGVVINVLWRRWMAAYAGTHRIEARPDEWGRTLLIAPPGAGSLSLRYQPPWLIGCRLGMLCAALATGCWGLLRRLEAGSERP